MKPLILARMESPEDPRLSHTTFNNINNFLEETKMA